MHGGSRALDLLDDLCVSTIPLAGRGARLRDADPDVRKRDVRILVDGQADERHDAHEEQHTTNSTTGDTGAGWSMLEECSFMSGPSRLNAPPLARRPSRSRPPQERAKRS